MNAKQFVNRYNITMIAEWADSNPNMADMPAGSSHWKCTLRCGRRQMTVFFSQGPAICHEPTAAEVLDCLASDASCLQGQSFENFCDELGYDTDSRKAERTYNALHKQTDKLTRFLADHFDQLVYQTERL